MRAIAPLHVVVALAAVLAATTARAGAVPPLSAVDPLAGARAALADGKLDEAKALAGAAGVDAPGLLGEILEKSGDKAGACALYAKDRASTRAPAAALRHAQCLEDALTAGASTRDVGAALAAYADVGASPLADDPLVVARIAAFIDKHDLPAAALAHALEMPVGAFDDTRRNSLADALFVVVSRGDPAQSSRALERLIVELPDTAAGVKASALPAAKARPAEDLAATLKRANALADRHESDAVIALLVPLVADKDNSATACEARLLLGKSYRKLHKLSAAKKAFDGVAKKCPDDVKKRAQYLAARVAWMSKSGAASVLLQAFASAWPGDPLTDDVLLWLGDDLERKGDVKGAQAAWSKITASFPDGDMIHDARFRLAWSRARSGDVAGARGVLDEAARGAGSRVDVADRALYWRARLALAPRLDSLEVTGDAKAKDAALAELVALAASRPASWYGLLARTLATSVHAPVATAPAHVRDGADKGTVTPSAALASDPRFMLAQNLVAAGYDAEALLALGAVDTAHAVAEDRFAIALLEGRAGAPGAGHALLRDGGLALLPGAPSTDNALAWSLDWPLAHKDAIVVAATEDALPPALLFGLAREESAFDADVVSWAGAVGLCQLMMPTAADEAKSKKLAVPSVEDLKDAALNARLGASHLSRRMRGLKHPALAIAAYNAGPGAVAQWSPTGPVDAWVEQIPVDETRNYVKKVTGSWATYAALDGSLDDVKLPLVLP